MKFGPTFGDEIAAAGLRSVPFTWDLTTGELLGLERLAPAQRDAIAAVVAAHNPDAPAPLVVDALAFRRLFTTAERVAISASPDPRVRVFMEDAAAAPSIRLAHPDVAAGLSYLLGLGLLTADRVAAVKSGTAPA